MVNNEAELLAVVKAARALVRECIDADKIKRNPSAGTLIALSDALDKLDEKNP